MLTPFFPFLLLLLIPFTILAQLPSFTLLDAVQGTQREADKIRLQAFPSSSSSSSSVGQMEAKGGTVPPPPVVCCMCGDRGLTKELFRCKICLDRSQHKYCSDLYLKAESYSACNWCLREKGAKSLAKEMIKDSNISISSSNSSDDISNGSEVKLHRRVFPSQFSKPIKKRSKPLDRSASDVTDRLGSEDLSPGLGRARQVFRGKARRYKLLEEFSS